MGCPVRLQYCSAFLCDRLLAKEVRLSSNLWYLSLADICFDQVLILCPLHEPALPSPPSGMMSTRQTHRYGGEGSGDESGKSFMACIPCLPPNASRFRHTRLHEANQAAKEMQRDAIMAGIPGAHLHSGPGASAFPLGALNGTAAGEWERIANTWPAEGGVCP